MRRNLGRLALVLSVLLPAWHAAPAAEPTAGPRARPLTTAVAASESAPPAKTIKLIDCVDEKYRDAVAAILKSPTISAKGTEPEFTAHASVYDWLLDRPDRTSTAWQRMSIPCVDIADLGKGQFFWGDANGSEISWQTVGTFEHGRIWFATGKVKPSPLLPSVPVKAVAVLHAPRGDVAEDGTATFKPVVHISIQCESRLAIAAMKMMGSSAPKLAEDGAEQLLFFFSGVARTIARKPERLEPLLTAEPLKAKAQSVSPTSSSKR